MWKSFKRLSSEGSSVFWRQINRRGGSLVWGKHAWVWSTGLCHWSGEACSGQKARSLLPCDTELKLMSCQDFWLGQGTDVVRLLLDMAGMECLNTKGAFWVKPPGHKIIFSNESLFSLYFSYQLFNYPVSLSMWKCFYDLLALTGWGLAYFPYLHFIITSLFLKFFVSYCSYELNDHCNSLQNYKANLYTCTEIIFSKDSEYVLWISQTSRHCWGCNQCSSCLPLQASNVLRYMSNFGQSKPFHSQLLKFCLNNIRAVM